MKKILIIAGEASGDLHGANLVREVRGLMPDASFSGVGSRNMRDAGVSMLADAADISVVGATEVLTHLGAILRVLNRVRRFMRAERPDLVVLIDFPDFNMLVARSARRSGIPVLYYISPQVWAWRKGRARTIAGLVKAIMVLFPFEVDIYRRAGADVRFVGHPLVDTVTSKFSRDEARRQFGLRDGDRTVALLPGSRRKEIEYLLPDMLGAARILRCRHPGTQIIVPVAPTLDADLVRSYTDRAGFPVTLVDGRVYDVLRASDAAIVTSGTATLETGLMAVPMVIIYRMSALSYAIGRLIVNAKDIGLVNIVAGRTIVPELLQEAATPEAIAGHIDEFLTDAELHRRTVEDLGQVRALLGSSGASRKAAGIVMEMLTPTA